ncbi:MAG: hypothetical protein ACREOP_14840, partial [Thermodesulfobacteriota bacterium]
MMVGHTGAQSVRAEPACPELVEGSKCERVEPGCWFERKRYGRAAETHVVWFNERTKKGGRLFLSFFSLMKTHVVWSMKRQRQYYF